jgi:hypothetical protein
MSADAHQDTTKEPLVMSLRTGLFVGEAGVADLAVDGCRTTAPCRAVPGRTGAQLARLDDEPQWEI